MIKLRSKRGVALPTAIAITAVLIILTSSLIMIALNSMSNTTADVNTRQAYINAKSALNYAAAYYNGGAELPGGGGSISSTEYIVMTDAGGTSTEGASVVQLATDSKVTAAKTYVEAEFIPRVTASDTDKLRLTAYALASDYFGQKAKTVQLTATYDVQNGTATPKKITSIVVKNDKKEVTYDTNDQITLNVRTNPNYDFVPYFYTWTYKDQHNGDDKGGIGYYYKDSQTSIGETRTVFSNYNTVEKVESAGSIKPSGAWNTDASNAGPQGVSVQKAGTTDWYQHNYAIKKNSVNYFHAIIARKGAMLTQTGGNINNAHRIQSCEMLHLWYGDPNDKNIYFEILKDDFYYYYSTDWDGKKGLEDYFLVYTSRPATVVHVKAINGRTSPINDNSANPSLSVTGLSVSSLQYEGCGWWATTIDTSSTFTANVVVGSKSYSTMVTPGNKEVWLVVDKSSGSLVSRSLESTANSYMNIDDNSYVTVSAKAYKGTTSTAPVLKYKFEQAQSSTAKRNLLNKILEAQEYISTDYTEDSFNALSTAINEATAVYNKTDLQTDAVYQAEIDKLTNAISKLVIMACDVETLNALKELYNNNHENYEKNKKDYDMDAYARLDEIFNYVDAVLNSKVPLEVRDATGAKTGTIITDSKAQMPKSVVEDATKALEAAMTNAEANKLDRNPLRDKITLATGIVDDTAYTAETRAALSAQITVAQGVLDTVTLKQADLDAALADLDIKYQATLNSKASILDTVSLSAHLTEAYNILTAVDAGTQKDYTDATYSALSTAYTNGSSTISSATNQAQVDEADAALTKALNDFTVYKPATSSDCYSENVIRVWLDMSAVYSGDTSAAEAGISVTVQKDDGTPFVPEISLDTTWKYYYFDIDKTAYNKATITFVYEGVTYTSATFDVKESDIILVADSLVEEGNKLSVTQKRLVTLYVPDLAENAECGGFFKPVATISTKVGETVSSVSLNLIKDSDHYFYCRFIYSEDTNVTIYQKADGAAPTVNSKEFKITNFGEYIANMTYNGATWDVSLLDVSDIYPKTNVSSPTPPTVSGTSYNYSANTSYTVSTLLQDNLNNGFSIQKLATSSTPITEEPKANCTFIWFDTEGISGISGTPRIHAWNDTSNWTDWAHRYSMTVYDSDARYYYISVPNQFTNIIITINGDNKYGNDTGISLKIDSTTGKPYTYQTISKVSSTAVANASNSKPTITTTTSTGGLDGTTAEVNMAFVGGKYYQLTNQSYGETFTSHWTNKFGGYWNGNSGSSCEGRIGDTKATVMYDWYDYKLPIDSGDLYSVQIKALSGSDSTVRYTESAQKIWGDSWFVLNSNTTASNLYSDVSIYSFDPADSQVTDDVTVYFKVPNSNWSNINLTAAGFGSTTTSMAVSSDATTYQGYTCYAATISSTMPYLTFSADVKGTDGSVTTKTFKTFLQGGDYLLFDPEMKLGEGAWQIFVDPITLLRREIVQSISTYYGKVLPTSYDANGFANGAYEKPEGFRSYVIGYLTGNNEVDSSKLPSSWSLAKSAYNTLHNARLAYESLYTVMSSARAYLSGHNYPEYLNRGTTATYEIGSLETDYNSAVAAYKSSSSTVSDINGWTSTLKTDIAGITIEHQNSAIAVFADVRNRVANGATLTMTYSKTPTGPSEGAVPVKQVNTENYPIYFIESSKLTDGTAYNVYFTITDASGSENTAKQDIKLDEAYVYLDYSGSSARWAANATTGYLDVNSNEITQNGTSKYNIKFEDSGSGCMTVYFAYDTTVTTTSNGTYTIPAGAYSFEKKTESGIVKGIFDIYGNAAPFTLSGTDYIMNLFTTQAKDYFSNNVTIGQFASGKTGEELGWVDGTSKQLKVTSTASTTQYANVTVNSVKSFNVSLGSLSGLYFRYTGSDGITINNKTFKLAAPEIRLALPSGGVTATSATMSHFYLASGDNIAKEIVVTFLTDVHVQYKDTLGIEHDFVIHEGQYKIKKNTALTQPGLIADLFDESYWKDNNFVTLINGSSSTSGTGNGTGTLGDAVYS
ncbi:MAG: hypothetical protein ACI4M3_04335 [Acutalibacteraceae bacterium]